MTTAISLRDPGDVVAFLPYQLGYHPRRSVVVVALHGRRVGLVARADLPPPELSPSGHRAAVATTVDTVAAPFDRERPEGVFLVGYEDEPDQCLPLLLPLLERLERDGAQVVEVAVVRDGRRWSPTCSKPCCPPEGVPLPSPDRVPGVAELVALGAAPLADRDDLDRCVAHDGSLPSPLTHRAGRRLDRPSRGRAVAAWAGLLGRTAPEVTRVPPPSRARVTRVATAAAGLADVALRDAVVAWLVPTSLARSALDPVVLAMLERGLPTWGGMGRWPAGPTVPGAVVDRADGRGTDGPGGEGPADGVERGERRALLELLLAACRCLPDDPPGPAAALCTVTAHVAWTTGDGALARAALDRALRLAPTYRLAQLLEQLVTQGVRPSTVAPPPRRDRAG